MSVWGPKEYPIFSYAGAIIFIICGWNGLMTVLARRWGVMSRGQSGHESHSHLSSKSGECFGVCPVASLARVFKSNGRCSNKCGPGQDFSLSIWILARTQYSGNISIWTSCFPPLDEQCFLGDKHKCHVFYINPADIIVWITFNSDCVSSQESILFKC